MKVFVKQYTSYGSFGEKIIPVNQWCDIKVNDINYHILT